MTTGTAIGIGVALAGAGGLAFLMLRKKDSDGATGATGVGDPLSSFVVETVNTAIRDPFGSQIVTLPELPPPPPMPVRPLGQPIEMAPGYGVLAAARTPIFVPPPVVLPAAPPPVPLASSVGMLYVPPGISQGQAYAKVSDLSAAYASTGRPEDDTSAQSTPASTFGPTAVARRGKGHF